MKDSCMTVINMEKVKPLKSFKDIPIPKDAHPNIVRFFKDTYNKAKSAGVSIKLPLAEKVKIDETDQVACSGWFDETDLVVAIGKPFEEWVSIFVHEACHMDQWIEDSEVWRASVIGPHAEHALEPTILFTLANNGDITLTKNQSLELANKSMRLELDCEKRAVEAIKEYELPIDIESYIKEANSYLVYYHCFGLKRRWYEKAPYKVKEVVDAMPSTFNEIDYEKPKRKYLKPILENCF